MRYLWPIPGFFGGPTMVGLGIDFFVRGQNLWGIWLLSLGLLVIGALIWAALQPGGWWQLGPWDREYWQDPDRWDR